MTLKTTIDTMEASDETFIPTGLVWGWRTMTPGAPLSSTAAASGPETRKFLILSTDGINTRSKEADHYHNGTNADLANALMETICDNIKADGYITLISVSYMVTDPDMNDRLKACASDPAYFYEAHSHEDLEKTFRQIAVAVSRYRLVK
jgi:hypothetical protein